MVCFCVLKCVSSFNIKGVKCTYGGLAGKDLQPSSLETADLTIVL